MPTPQQTTSQPTLPETNQPSLPPPAQVPQLDPITASLYQPATRWRLQKSSTSPCTTRNNAFWTISSTTWTATTNRWAWSTPYAEPPSNESANNLEDSPFAFEVEDMEINALPPGWKLENGYITLDDKTWPLGTSSWMFSFDIMPFHDELFWSSCNTCPCLWIA